MGLYADVIIDISHERVDRPFTYRVPESLERSVAVGAAVMVPFGAGNGARKAYITELKTESELPDERLKAISGIAEGDAPAEAVLIRLAAWMKRSYGSTMIAALKTVLPAGKKTKAREHKSVVLSASERDARELLAQSMSRANGGARVRLLSELISDPAGELPMELVNEKLHVSREVVKSLADKGVVRVISRRAFRNPVSAGSEGKTLSDLSPEQLGISDSVIEDYDRGVRKTYLLCGITGSGKTEVYIRCISEMIKRGRQAIVLIPEIALTWQTLKRFYGYFGDRVSVMNSSLSAGEKYDQFERARRGDIDVIIGPRSALFTPFPRTGLIVIDEEHELSYKSETMPKYHARETAEELARLVPGGASVLLGSATPSMEALYRAKRGIYGYFTLDRRFTGGSLPRVETVDMREELKAGNRTPFSRVLKEKLERVLDLKEQAMLFINRRGIAGFVSCRSCGHVFKCPHCDVSLSAHGGGRLICHYCGHEEAKRDICPVCGSRYVSGFRAGTETMEEQVKKLFPAARVLRMDADTTRGKGSYERILRAFGDGEADILIGTQMIVKGHDFPRVTLMGVLAADLSLNTGDYRAAERTYELLVQAAGRAGRGDRPGSVVIQTYQPDSYAVRYAAAQDPEGFYRQEMSFRELAGYPPAAHLLAVQIYSDDGGRGAEYAGRLKRLFDKKAGEGKRVSVMGPAPAAIGKIADVYRFGLYIKSGERERLVEFKDAAEELLSADRDEKKARGISLQFDFDPVRTF